VQGVRPKQAGRRSANTRQAAHNAKRQGVPRTGGVVGGGGRWGRVEQGSEGNNKRAQEGQTAGTRGRRPQRPQITVVARPHRNVVQQAAKPRYGYVRPSKLCARQRQGASVARRRWRWMVVGTAAARGVGRYTRKARRCGKER